jgi:hypothetical protein
MSNDNLPKGLPRREFLKFGAWGIIAGAVSPTILRGAPMERPTPSGMPLLSVGYADAAPSAGEAVRLQPASSILTGDIGFLSRGARLTFESFARGAKYRDRLLGGAAIDVVYPVRSYTDERMPRFRAWSFNGRQEGESVSGPISFNVPVSATGGVQLIVRRTQSDAPETAESVPRGGASSSESAAPLSLGFDSRLAKLQRGVYVIAFRETDDDVMTSWDLFRLSRRGNNLVVTPAPFSYVLMNVDYAK